MKNWLVELLLASCLVCTSFSCAYAAEVVVVSGLEETIGWLESEGWWGEGNRSEQLMVPKIVITEISPRWQKTSKDLPVPQKKEIFYRLILPLVLHANSMVLERRERLKLISAQLASGSLPSEDDLQWLGTIVKPLRISTGSGWQQSIVKLQDVIEESLYKLDVIPPGLALGQAAYESGYGTSRFAGEGNALFGQWTFGGEGLVPEQQRQHLGDHRIASYRWPFDSVRAYVINLNTHPAYEKFRKIRAELRAEGQALSSLVMADGLTSYSERGQAYVDTLKGIIRFNKLDIADDAAFRDETLKFVVGAASEEEAVDIRRQLDKLRMNGELSQIIKEMNLE